MALLGSSGLEDHPDGTGNINAIISGNWDTIDEWFNVAAGMSASQSSGNVTSSAPVFITDMVGATIVWTDGSTALISSISSSTVAVCTPSQTVSSQSFEIFRNDVVMSPQQRIAAALMKRTRFISTDNGKVPVWNQSDGQFEFQDYATWSGGGGRPAFETLAASGTINLDFNAATTSLTTMTGAVTFGTSANLSAGAKKDLVIKYSTGSGALTFPSGWTFVGNAKPTSITAGHVFKISLTSIGTTDSQVIASYLTS